jgi:SAM-dependent methyltransferase
MTTTMQQQTAAPWPLAQRVTAGLVCPGGRPMVARALEGVGLEEGDRVVEMAPGLGITSAIVLERGPRTWVGLEPDPIAREHLERVLGGPSRRVLDAPPAASGLEDESASVVIVDALLSTLERDGRAAVLAEAARLLRSGGRLALHELAPAGDDPEAAAAFAGIGVTPLTEDEWRAASVAAGLVPVGSLTGRLAMPSPREIMREAGPRTALRITRELARDGAVRSAALAARRVVEDHELWLRSALVVAEKPLVSGLRRPRRP